MSNFKDMPLDTTLQKGDIVTITGPGEHDVTVREVIAIETSGLLVVGGMYLTGVRLDPSDLPDDRTLTRIQRPVPALPTVEGDYILTYNISGGCFARIVWTLAGGVWSDALGDTDRVSVLESRLDGGATLTRVIPADEVKRPEVDVEAATSAFLDLWVASTGSVKVNFKTVLLRVLNGEFDL